MERKTHVTTDRARQALSPDDVAAIYEQFSQPVFAFFYRHTGQRQDAEDLTAITFAKILMSIERYTEQGAFEAWLWSIAWHTLRDAQRRQEDASLDHAIEHLRDPAPSPEYLAIQAEQTAMLHQILRALPADQQQAIVLRFMHEWSFGEIAHRLGRSVGAVKMLVQRALATLRTRYPQVEHLHRSMPRDVEPSSAASHTSTTRFRIDRGVAAVLTRAKQACFLFQSLPVLQPAVVRVRHTDLYIQRHRR